MIDASALLDLVVFVVTLPLLVALTALGIRELFGKPEQPPQGWTRRVVSLSTRMRRATRRAPPQG